MKKSLKRYFSYPQSELLIATLVTFMIFMLLEICSRTYNLFYHFPEIDIPLHFLSGFSLTIGFLWVLNFSEFKGVSIKNKRIVSVMGTFIVAILWELVETLQELFIVNTVYLQDIFFWDGFFDVFFALVGAVAAILLLKFLKNKTDLFCDINI